MEKQLALKYIKSRKKKNIIAVVTIALVMAFLTAVCIYGYSYGAMEKRFFKAYNGSYHGTISGISDENIEKLNRHADVKSVSEIIEVKAEITEANNIFYRYYSNEALDQYSFSVTLGKYPQDKNEVAIDKLYGEKFNKKMGDTLEIDGKEFKVVGIIDNKDYTRKVEDSPYFEVFMSKSYGVEVTKERTAFITLNSIEDYELTFESLGKLIGVDSDNIIANETQIFVEMQGVGAIAPFALVGGLVALSAFFIIYNIFHLALGERMKSIGLLLTIGVTSKQIRKIVLIEALILSLIAIPFGVALGFLGTKVMMDNIVLNSDLRFLVHPVILPVAIILTLLTVIISVIKPAFKISKLSPIEASRYVQRDDIKGKKVKESKDFFKDLARANLNRNKKVNRITRISLVLSIILFMVCSSIFRSMGVENLAKKVISADVQVDLGYMSIYEGKFIDEDIFNKIKNVDGAENTIGYKGILVNKSDEEGIDILVGVNEEEIKALKSTIIEGEINEEAFKRGDEVVAPVIHKGSKFKVGESISIKLKDGNSKSVKVSAIVSEELFHFEAMPNIIYGFNNGDVLKASDEYVKILVDTKDGKSKEISKRVEGITSNYKHINTPKNYEDTYEQLMGEKKSIVMIGYVIVFVVALIGIMNLINSTLAGILARRKELGMLRAVGITDGEIKKMLIAEGLYGVGIALGFGIIIGNIFAYIAVALFKNMGATYAVYTFPLVETIICIVMVILLLIFVTRSVIGKITKDSVVEQIRYED